MNVSSPELHRLQQEVRESRVGISREYAGLLSDLDVQKRFTESVKRHPLGWLGGAAAAGLLATLLGSGTSRKAGKSPPEPVVPGSGLSKMGWIAGALEVGKLVYPILRPVVVDFVSKRVRTQHARHERLQLS